MISNIDSRVSNNIRALSVAMVEKANSGHPGGPMGRADFIHILYSEFFNYDPTDMTWSFRDRFFMDAGHLSTLMYAQYYLLGNYAKDDLINFRQWGSNTPGHPEVDVVRGIEKYIRFIRTGLYYENWSSYRGLPFNPEGLVGEKGKVFGLDHFGYSAPANILDDKFGFTG
jgi:transketolase